MNPNDTTSNSQQYSQQGSQQAMPAQPVNSDNDLTTEEVFPPQVFGPTKSNPVLPQNSQQMNSTSQQPFIPTPAPQQFQNPNPFLPPGMPNQSQPYQPTNTQAPPMMSSNPVPNNAQAPQQFQNPNPFLPPGMPSQNPAYPPASNQMPPNLPQNPFMPPPFASSNNVIKNPTLPPAQPSNLARQELIDHLKKANNVLVTVSSNPSVDQLTAAIGITLILNKLDKHATAVFSGKTPSTLEFLQPEKTIEKNTDSLRDFIIALDKAKADKLRYKVEDKFVKIFITPYHTSISDEDLVFSQGDFNVDVILALGVHQREELDQAITAHGRILHDAVTVSINNKITSDLGAVNWFDADASSLCEMLVGLIEPLQGNKALLDNQIATSFLTGVVAETERFSNEKTTPRTMNVAATLMKAGANQQLVSSKLEEPALIPEDDFDKVKLDELANEKGAKVDSTLPVPVAHKDGSLDIEHKKSENEDREKLKTLQELEKENNVLSDPDEQDEYGNLAKIHIDEQGKMHTGEDLENKSASKDNSQLPKSPTNMIVEPPSIGGAMSSVSGSEQSSIPAIDQPQKDTSSTAKAKTIEPLDQQAKDKTLSELEEAVHSRHRENTAQSDLEQARELISKANNFNNSQRLEPISALNANPIDLNLRSNSDSPNTENKFPSQLVGPDNGPPQDPTASNSVEPGSPPPVPPPLMPPTT